MKRAGQKRERGKKMNELWALPFDMAEQVLAELALAKAKPQALVEGFPERKARGYELVGGVAVIPVSGAIVREQGWYGTGQDAVSSALKAALADPSARAILFDINSPGGVITAGMAIYDTMQYIKCDVSTICMGMAASMGAFLLAAGAKGKRYALPNAEIMIHQPSGGAQGQATDIQIQAERILQKKKSLNTILAERTGQPYEVICKDTERDNFMTAQQAMEYGLIDKVIATKSK